MPLTHTHTLIRIHISFVVFVFFFLKKTLCVERRYFTFYELRDKLFRNVKPISIKKELRRLPFYTLNFSFEMLITSALIQCAWKTKKKTLFFRVCFNMSYHMLKYENVQLSFSIFFVCLLSCFPHFFFSEQIFKQIRVFF